MKKLILLIMASLAFGQGPTGYVNPSSVVAMSSQGWKFLQADSVGSLYVNAAAGGSAQTGGPSGYISPVAMVGMSPTGTWKYLRTDSSGNLYVSGGVASGASLPVGACTNGSLYSLTGGGLYQCIATVWVIVTPTGTMTQAVANSAANTVSVSVGTSGTAFQKTPVTIDPSTGDTVFPGNVAISTTCPTGAPTGSICSAGSDGALNLMILRTASATVRANHLVKGTAADTVGEVIADGEGILGVAWNGATVGQAVWVTVLGLAPCATEGTITDLHYLKSGTSDPSACLDSGQTSMGAISSTERVMGKARETTSGATVKTNVIGPYRFGAQPAAATGYWQTITLPYTDSIFTAANTTVTKTAVAIPAHGWVNGCRLKSTAAFAGTGITSMYVTVGTAGTADYYCPALSLTDAVANTQGQSATITNAATGWSADANVPVSTDAGENAIFTVVANVNVGSGSATVLTQGSVTLSIWISTLY